MCGFFVTNNRLNLKTKYEIINRLAPRGPDDIQSRICKEGSYIFARLEITGRKTDYMQPLNSNNLENQDFFFFNGEVYNYKSLSKNFLKQKISNKISDAHVLDRLFKKKGYEKTFSLLNGMFSIAVVKKKFKSIILARDQFGQKPMYYAINGKYWYASSDPYSISICIKKGLDYKQLKSFLYSSEKYGTRGLINSSKTFFKNIHQLEPGNMLHLNEKKFIKKNIYKLPFFLKNKNYKKDHLDSDEKIKYFNSLLKKKVEEYCDNHNDVAFSYSGGIDSSLLTLNSLGTKKNNYYFTKIAKGIDQVAEESFKNLSLLKKYKVAISQKDYLEETIDFIKFSGAPSRWGTAPSMLPLYREMKKKELKICIGGDGADEIFFGYKNYAEIYKTDYQTLKKKSPLGLINEFSNSGWQNINSNIIGEYKNQKMMPLIKKYIKYNKNFKSSHFEICKFVRWIDFNLFLPSIPNIHSDLCSMQNSIELRSPFLDFEIINFVEKYLNEKDFFGKNGNPKNFLKKSLLTLSKKHKSILKLPSFEEKHGTRNFAFQAFENINVKKISKEFKQKIKLNIDYKISSKFKYKLFVTYIFFLIFNKEYAKDKILKDLK